MKFLSAFSGVADLVDYLARMTLWPPRIRSGHEFVECVDGCHREPR